MKKIFFLFFVLLNIGLILAIDDYFCFTKLENNQSVPSIVNSIGDNLICADGKCTCSLNSGDGYCLVCTNSSGWHASYNECNSDYCDPSENVTGPLDLLVKFPFDNGETTTKQRFYVLINTTRKSKIDLINNLNDVKKNLCMHCNYFNKVVFFNEGLNNITIKSAVAGEVEQETLSFFVDTKKPRITKVYPLQNKFATGDFKIVYEENNIKTVKLYYGEKNNIQSMKLDCENGKQECFVKLNLDSYNGKSIYYWFNIIDIAANNVNSSKVKIFVDNKAPVINSIKSSLNRGFYEITLNISDDNFQRAVYFEGEKEKLFCSSLKKGICSKSLRLNDSLRIKVYDLAGNSAEETFVL